MSFESGDPVVVDSPLPPESSFGGAVPPEPEVPDSSDDSDGDSFDPAQPEAPEQPETDAWREEFESRYGLDVSGFSDRQNAEAAVRLQLAEYANSAVAPGSFAPPEQSFPDPYTPQPLPPAPQYQQTPYPPQYAPPQQAPQPGQMPDMSTWDPQVAAAYQQLQSQVMQTAQETHAMRQYYAQQQQAQEAAAYQQVAFRAGAAVDKLASPRYGVGKKRSPTQRRAAQHLMRSVYDIASGMVSKGAQVPEIERLVEMALILEGESPNRPASPPVAPPSDDLATGLGGVLPGRVQAPQRYREPQLRPYDSSDPLGIKSDPTFRANVRRIWNRGK